MTLPFPAAGVFPGNAPRTRMNDDHSMHIPGISSHRNVNNSNSWPGPGATCTGIAPGQLSLQRTGGMQPLL